MSDNIQAQAVTTPGVTFASDDLAGVQHPRVKIEIGADGTATDVSETNPVPVRLNDGSANLNIASLDLDSGVGTVNRVSVGIALPSAGGPVAGGTATFPIRIDPTGTTFQPVRGMTEHDEPVVENPFSVAYRASANEPTAVDADGDVVYAWGDRQGRAVAVLNFPSNVAAAGTNGPTSGTKATSGDTDAIATPGASLSIYVTGICVTNSNATGNQVQFKDGAGGVSGINAWVTNSAPVQMQYNPPWKLTANTALVINCSGALANTIWTVHFFVAP